MTLVFLSGKLRRHRANNIEREGDPSGFGPGTAMCNRTRAEGTGGSTCTLLEYTGTEEAARQSVCSVLYLRLFAVIDGAIPVQETCVRERPKRPPRLRIRVRVRNGGPVLLSVRSSSVFSEAQKVLSSSAAKVKMHRHLAVPIESGRCGFSSSRLHPMLSAGVAVAVQKFHLVGPAPGG